jgi:3-hydroxybutyryl-CoA dehydratase
MQVKKGKTIEEMKIGDQSSLTKTFSEHEVYQYAFLTGDFNPAHTNEEYAKSSLFGTRIVHGMLVGGLISAILGTDLPGPGTIYLEQNLQFKKAVKMGETVTAKVIITDILHKEKFDIVTLKTSCYNQDDELVLDGIAKIIPPK